MKSLKTVKITIEYICPMWVGDDESDMSDIFETNKKDIMDGYEYSVTAEQDSKVNWSEDAQVFRKEGTWLDIQGAELLMRVE